MKYVFVCRDGQHRSAIAARKTLDIMSGRYADLETDYFGVRGNDSNEEKREILNGADFVFVMEENMRFDLRNVLGYKGKLVCLNILNSDDADDRMVERRLREEFEKLGLI